MKKKVKVAAKRGNKVVAAKKTAPMTYKGGGAMKKCKGGC